ncbi:MAG: TIGR01440 family protein [Brotaphodocola sp.]
MEYTCKDKEENALHIDKEEMKYKRIEQESYAAAKELISAAHLDVGNLLVVGCSTSEVSGENIGSFSNPELGKALFNGIYRASKEAGVFLVAQCCEHLNRALILEREAAVRYGYEEVNVIPQPKAGGSFATAAYQTFEAPTAVEHIKAHAGMDIGDTLIGMHLKDVAVPVRLSVRNIGAAHLVCARTRRKFIGGSRAVYDEKC